MNNLFKLSAEYQRLMDKINEVDEIDPPLMEALLKVNDSFENKVLAYASIIKSMELKAQSLDVVIEGLLKRYMSLSKGAASLREKVLTEMKNCNKDRLENEYHKLLLVFNNPKVIYSDKSLVPEQFLRKKVVEIVEPDTSMISKALKENIEVPGAYLVKEQRLEIK